MKRIPLIEIGSGAGVGLIAWLAVQGVNVMPFVFMLGLIVLLTQAGGLRSMAPRRVAAAPTGTVPNIRFEDIGGQGAAKKELLEALDFMTNQELIRRMGIRPLKGILLTGPPGTGKTMLAKAAAHHTGSVFLAASGSEFVEMYAGVGAQRVRELFRKAREVARKEKKRGAVVFIDEIDVLGARRGSHSGHMEYDQTLNQLLTEMDGLVVDEEVQVMVMAATNRVDIIDSALLRPGRFDRVVNVDLPDKEGRLMVLQVHTRSKPVAPEVNLDEVARQTFGFSGAHLESLANEAAILAMREGAETIHSRHFTEAVDKVMLGEKMDRTPGPEEKRRIAIHEAGHALVGEWVEPGSVATVTVTPRGRAMGYVRTNPPDDHYLYTLPMLEARIQVALAGFLAEELVCGQGSTGATADFQQVSELARRIVSGGMSRMGIVDTDTMNKAAAADEVQRIIQGQQDLVSAFLAEHQTLLEKVADQLVRAEVVDGPALRQLIQEQNRAA